VVPAAASAVFPRVRGAILPVAADGGTFEEAITEMAGALREFAEDRLKGMPTVSQADVAAFMLDVVADKSWIRQTA